VRPAALAAGLGLLVSGLVLGVGCRGVTTRAQSPTDTIVVEPSKNPAPPGATTPNLTSDDAGRVYLSWVLESSAGNRLQYARLDEGGWSPVQTIASGDDWFVNWADVASLAVDGEGPVAAHFLRKSGESTYAYDAVLTTPDGAGGWQPPTPMHLDRSPTEHGFVSLVPLGEGQVFATWLDGRNFADAGEPPGADAGPMTLRYGIFGPDGVAAARGLLDDRTCECCPTAAAQTSQGVLVAYRDRSPDEVRDIYVVRVGDEGATDPARVHDDGWVINGCPVNGPALAASGEQVALAWFTATGGSPAVKVSFSADAGASFGTPYRLDEGRPLGRVATALLDDGSAVVVWLETRDTGTQILARHVDSSGPRSAPVALAETSGTRASGYPRLTRGRGGLVAAWTETGDPSYVRTASLALPSSGQRLQ